MGVSISIHAAIIVVSAIGALFTALAVLFGALTFFFICEGKKRKRKHLEAKEQLPKGDTPSKDDVRCDSAYGTAASSLPLHSSGSVPSPCASMDTNTSQSHQAKPMKDTHELEMRNFSNMDDTRASTSSPVPVNDSFKFLHSLRAAPYAHRQGDDLIVNQDAEAALHASNPVKRTNSYLSSVITEEPSETFTVLTVHKSTLKRRPKASRTNSLKPLMAGEEREGYSDEEEKTEKERNAAAPQALGYGSESVKKSKPSPLPRRYFVGGSHGHQKPTPRKAARSNSTKPLMASEDDDEMEEPTQEDWDAIQGVDSPPNRKSLVLENRDIEVDAALDTLHLDLLQMISRL